MTQEPPPPGESPPGLPASDHPIVSFEYPSIGPIQLSGQDASEYVFRIISASHGFYEADLLDILEHLGLPRGGLAVDVGAHIGNHSVFFAMVLGLRTLAIEPEPTNFALLERNVDLNHLRDLVSAFNVALGSEEGRGRAEQRVPGNTGSVVITPEADGPVEILTLDKLVDPGEDVVLLKIDVEGRETGVIEGSFSTLERCRPVLCVEAHDGRALQAIETLISPLGYAPIAVSGRSDNYLFIADSEASPIQSLTAARRARLVADRRVSQSLGTGLTDISSQVRSLGLQSQRQFDRLVAQVEGLESRVREVESRIKPFSRETIAERDRAIARWRIEYERVTRSRAVRAAAAVRRGLARLGLSSQRPVMTVSQVEEAIKSDESHR